VRWSSEMVDRWVAVDPSPGTRTAGTQGTVYVAVGLSKKRWVLGIARPD
jgi:hypothetical protein